VREGTNDYGIRKDRERPWMQRWIQTGDINVNSVSLSICVCAYLCAWMRVFFTVITSVGP
jgi:hypothetical protein